MVTHHPSCMVPCWWVFGSLNLDRLCQLSFIHWGAELMKKVGWGSGFGERVGWNLGEVGERVGWRTGGRGNCTISQFYIWMNVMGPGRLCHPRHHKWMSDDASSRACEAPSHICQQHPRATQHEKTWVRKKRNATSPFCMDKHPSQFLKLLMKICSCCCTNPEMVGPISSTQHRAPLSLSLSPLVFQLRWQIWLVVSFAKFVH